MKVITMTMTEAQSRYFFLKECNMGIADLKLRKEFVNKLSVEDREVWKWGESIDWWVYRW